MMITRIIYNADRMLAHNFKLFFNKKKTSTMPPPHNFRNYFTLTNNPNNPTNAIAVCNCCIRKYGGLGIAQLKPECCTVNRARLCRTHLSKCEAFHESYSEEEVKKILALPVPEDKKKTEKKTEALTVCNT